MQTNRERISGLDLSPESLQSVEDLALLAAARTVRNGSALSHSNKPGF
jgi:hypothetical protein